MQLSIITPTLNAGRHIADCLRSLPADREGRWEHLVVDGNSSDDTHAQVTSIANEGHRHIRFILDQGSGIYQAMNRGLREAQGRYVFFLGADDRICGEGLQSFLAAVPPCTSSPNSNVVFYGDVEYDNGVIVRSRPEGLARKNTLHHQGCIYDRDRLLEMGGYDTRYRILADYDLNCRLSRSAVRFERLGGRIAICGARGISTKGRWVNYREEIEIRLRNYGPIIGAIYAPYSIGRFFYKKIRAF